MKTLKFHYVKALQFDKKELRLIGMLHSGGISMIKVGIIGSTGYAGAELVRLLLGHKEAEIVWYGSRSYVDKRYAEYFRKNNEKNIVYCENGVSKYLKQE